MKNKLTDNSDIKTALKHLKKEQKKYLLDLKKLCKIPSISFPQYPQEHMNTAATFLENELKKTGIENSRLIKIKGSPAYVYGDFIKNKDLPTVLLYAHYDVQPPMRKEIWNSNPFGPIEKNGRIWGRGTADDKGGVIIHLATISSYLKTVKSLPVNVKVLFEGEEEIGSPGINKLLKKYKKELKADYAIIMDGSNYDSGTPAITTSLRGMVGLSVEVFATKSPLHSGQWGGAIPDPVIALSKMLSGLVDKNGRIAIPGILPKRNHISKIEIEDMKKFGMTETLFKKQSKTLKNVKLFGKDYKILQKTWKEPTITVNSINAGDRKEAGNVIMDSAWAKISIRTVEGMDGEKTLNKLSEYLKKQCPWGLKLEIKKESGIAKPWKANIDHKIFSITKEALTLGYGKKAIFAGCGASIPIIPIFKNNFPNLKVLLLGVGDNSTNIHSENESLKIDDLFKAIKSQIYLLDRMVKQ